jgi:hypothetical protein
MPFVGSAHEMESNPLTFKDFRSEKLAPFDIEGQHPDDFVRHSEYK